MLKKIIMYFIMLKYYADRKSVVKHCRVLSQEDIANADAGDTADDKNEDDVTFDEKGNHYQR